MQPKLMVLELEKDLVKFPLLVILMVNRLVHSHNFVLLFNLFFLFYISPCVIICVFIIKLCMDSIDIKSNQWCESCFSRNGQMERKINTRDGITKYKTQFSKPPSLGLVFKIKPGVGGIDVLLCLTQVCISKTQV